MLIRGPVVRVRDHLPMLCGLALVVWLPGCTTGPKLVIPTGKLLNRGAPLTSDTKLGVTLTFHADAREGRPPASYVANIDRESATFTVPGPQGKGIPEGTYRVSVLLMSINPTEWMDDVNQQFSPTNTRVIREVKEGESLTIDLSKPEG